MRVAGLVGGRVAYAQRIGEQAAAIAGPQDAGATSRGWRRGLARAAYGIIIGWAGNTHPGGCRAASGPYKDLKDRITASLAGLLGSSHTRIWGISDRPELGFLRACLDKESAESDIFPDRHSATT